MSNFVLQVIDSGPDSWLVLLHNEDGVRLMAQCPDKVTAEIVAGALWPFVDDNVLALLVEQDTIYEETA